MSTRAEQERAEAQRHQSATRRAAQGEVLPNKNARQKDATLHSKKGRALHAPTKQRADAKAGKPDPGRVPDEWKTGVNGGEDQTRNGVTEGRGADGPASVHKASRKSTRGEVPGGEKGSQLPRARTRRVHSPATRAEHGY